MTGNHTYTAASTFDADGNLVPFAMNVKVTDNINGTVGSGDGPATVTPIQVSIVGTAAASELDSTGAGFYFARTGDVTAPLTVHYKVDSSLPNAAAPGTNYEALSGTVTIDAGESGVFVPLKTLDDKVAGWTKAVKVDVQDGGGQYVFDPIQNTATDEIVDSDLSIKLGNGAEGLVLKASPDGTHNLLPLTLNAPTEKKAGAVITLAVLPGSPINIWTTSNPKPGDKPLIGQGTWSYTWVGTSQSPPTTLYVGATSASSQIIIGLGDDESQVTKDAPANPTMNLASTKPATSVFSTWNEVAPDVLDMITALKGLELKVVTTLEPIILALTPVVMRANFLMSIADQANLKTIEASTFSLLFNVRNFLDVTVSVGSAYAEAVFDAKLLEMNVANGVSVFAEHAILTKATIKLIGHAAIVLPIIDWAANTVYVNILNIRETSALFDGISEAYSSASIANYSLISTYNAAIIDGNKLENLFHSLDGQPCTLSVDELNQMRASLLSEYSQLNTYVNSHAAGWNAISTLTSQLTTLLNQVSNYLTFKLP